MIFIKAAKIHMRCTINYPKLFRFLGLFKHTF